jgi:hypothetical protein
MSWSPLDVQFVELLMGILRSSQRVLYCAEVLFAVTFRGTCGSARLNDEVRGEVPWDC